MRPSSPFLHITTLLASLRSVSSVAFDCNHVVDDRVKWDLSALAGPKTVHWVREEPPSIKNTTFTIDLCAPLKRTKGVPLDEQCESGTWICGVEQVIRPDENTTQVDRVIPVAGEYTATHGRALESRPTRLKNSDSNADADMEGVRVEFSGSRYPLNGKSGVKQKAIIEFICDPSLTGNEGCCDDDKEREPRRIRKDEEENGELPDLDKGKSIQFKSYREQPNGDAWVLRLEWRTMYACENAKDIAPPKQGGWGFFTWFIIVYVVDLPLVAHRRAH